MRARSLALVLLIALLLACSGGTGESARTESASGGPAEGRVIDFALTDLQGRVVRLSDSAGKVRLVDFWATWCAPCVEEIPMFKDLHAAYGPRGFTLLAISDEGADVVRPFVEKHGIPWTNLVDEEGEVAEKFGGVFGLPTAFLLDGEGRVVEQLGPGLVPRSVLEPKIQELLGR